VTIPSLPLLLLPTAVGVVCAALALTAARRRPGAPPAPPLTPGPAPAVPGPENGADGLTVADAATAVVETWAAPPAATRAAIHRALAACKVTDPRHPEAAHAEQTALTRYLAYALASAAHRTQRHLLPDGITVRNVTVAPDPGATLAELAAARMLQATIAGDRETALDVITLHATLGGTDPLSVAVAQARVAAIVTDYACRVGVWLRSIPAAVAAHHVASDESGIVAVHVCGCGCADDEGRSTR
jgi:hypothetical protein